MQPGRSNYRITVLVFLYTKRAPGAVKIAVELYAVSGHVHYHTSVLCATCTTNYHGLQEQKARPFVPCPSIRCPCFRWSLVETRWRSSGLWGWVCAGKADHPHRRPCPRPQTSRQSTACSAYTGLHQMTMSRLRPRLRSVSSLSTWLQRWPCWLPGAARAQQSSQKGARTGWAPSAQSSIPAGSYKVDYSRNRKGTGVWLLCVWKQNLQVHFADGATVELWKNLLSTVPCSQENFSHCPRFRLSEHYLVVDSSG